MCSSNESTLVDVLLDLLLVVLRLVDVCIEEKEVLLIDLLVKFLIDDLMLRSLADEVGELFETCD
ncbi:hypothetical protein JD969_14860 [Planctomycetota bacterium]|nr:hypothetical protein JD969_14860 [Planctomycetota bacterium]